MERIAVVVVAERICVRDRVRWMVNLNIKLPPLTRIFVPVAPQRIHRPSVYYMVIVNILLLCFEQYLQWLRIKNNHKPLRFALKNVVAR